MFFRIVKSRFNNIFMLPARTLHLIVKHT
jgi:hypothetical protein